MGQLFTVSPGRVSPPLRIQTSSFNQWANKPTHSSVRQIAATTKTTGPYLSIHLSHFFFLLALGIRPIALLHVSRIALFVLGNIRLGSSREMDLRPVTFKIIKSALTS